MRKQSILAGAILMAVLFGAASCQPQPDAIIHYQEIRVCQGIPQGYTAPPAAKIILFRVNSIDNTQVNTQWTFDRKAILFDPLSQCQYNLTASKPIVVSANQSVTLNQAAGVVFISNDPNNATQVQPGMLYGVGATQLDTTCQDQLGLSKALPVTVPAHPGTIWINDNQKQTSYPYTSSCTGM